MDFYIKNIKRKMTLLLPITPESYEIEYNNDIETVRLTNFGDINIPTHHTPITLEFEGLFSVNPDHNINKKTVSNMRHAMDYVNLIKTWINNKDIVRVVITKDTKSRIDLDFYIEGIQYSEDGETVGDIKYKITFREYRPLKTNTTTKPKPTRSSSKPKSSSKNRIYIVKNGDYLKKISRQFYGTSKKWTVIYNANKKVIGKNPDLIYPNQRFIIP